ncbi:long-chain-fatty-acid--CoA ligase [Fictibacillus fluitans]|uniref:Long-chain fatty acid--CoA ligase n=1 Tax=Fictibacillus fluitans TaxID=3058422 RepID=A0ABT8HQF0_9BACL|nr:long-chain fatty acid--CoA ligase [Fictibacillus sp. NE201]MDN4522988.1 long-chain fatty acid--CoA ligase [Fictibacillus sp. NE201]
MHHVSNRPWSKYYDLNQSNCIPDVSVYSILETAAKKYGDRTAILFEHQRISFLELKNQTDRLAAAWCELGLQKGQRIGLMLSNHPDYIISYYAAQALGLIVVQINPFYTSRELLQIVFDAEISYIVADPNAFSVIQEIKEQYTFHFIFSSQITDKDMNPLVIKLEDLKKYSDTLSGNTPMDSREEVAVLQYTGGTTGKMKGVMLTHHNLLANVIQSYTMYGEKMIPGQETVLAATPLYHVYGMTSAMNLGIYIGATLLLFKKFDADYILPFIKEYRPTFFPGVPKMYNAFVNQPSVENYGLNCLKLCSCGSAPLPVEVIKRFETLTGATIGEGFGLSEASPSTHRNPSSGVRKLGSIGIPMPGTDCLIVDERRQELPPHSVGELAIKGPQIMKGYWKNNKETKDSLQNGWLFTGDLATMDEDGYFYIVGRKKEMVIVGGFNIYPQEVEGVLYEHPDVQEAAVVGIPHKEEGEVVKAYLVPKNGCVIDLAEIRGHCYHKLARYKVPKEFEIRDSLPRNTVGKLLKRMLVQEEKEKGAIKHAKS